MEIANEIMTFLFAGHETTSVAVSHPNKSFLTIDDMGLGPSRSTPWDPRTTPEGGPVLTDI
jgi:hypothetical protein